MTNLLPRRIRVLENYYLLALREVKDSSEQLKIGIVPFKTRGYQSLRNLYESHFMCLRSF
jgi:hypothetical protein